MLFLKEVPTWYIWLALAPAISRVSRRFPLTDRRFLSHAPVHLVTACGAIGLHFLVVGLYQRLILGMNAAIPFGEVYLFMWSAYLPTFLIVYASLVGVQHTVILNEALQQRILHASRLETRLAHAQLDVLKTQLQPHFLFNTITTIVSLMQTNVEAAQVTLLRLSDLLRRSLRNAASHEASLHDELAFLEEYVAIQKTRFGDRLNVYYEIDAEARDWLVPRLLLQPLVENAIRHGLQPMEASGTIVVRAKVSASQLELDVQDDGVGLPEVPATPGGEGGIGLRNTRARLQQLYGPEHQFRIEGVFPHGTRVWMSFPRRIQSSHAEFIDVAEHYPNGSR
jgi:signal transduction histidine kinase